MAPLAGVGVRGGLEGQEAEGGSLQAQSRVGHPQPRRRLHQVRPLQYFRGAGCPLGRLRNLQGQSRMPARITLARYMRP